MPQTKYETCFVLEWNASEENPLYRPEGRAALAGQTIPEWMRMIGFGDQITDPGLLAEIQERLGLPDRPGGAFTMHGAPFLVFYENAQDAGGPILNRRVGSRASRRTPVDRAKARPRLSSLRPHDRQRGGV